MLQALSFLALDTSRDKEFKPLWGTSQEHCHFSLPAFPFPWRGALLRSGWEEKCSRRDPGGSGSCELLFQERFLSVYSSWRAPAGSAVGSGSLEHQRRPPARLRVLELLLFVCLSLCLAAGDGLPLNTRSINLSSLLDSAFIIFSQPDHFLLLKRRVAIGFGEPLLTAPLFASFLCGFFALKSKYLCFLRFVGWWWLIPVLA